MEVHFTVPDDLARRIEYIPEQVLPEVLASVFRAGVEEMTRSKREDSAHGKDMGQILASVLDAVKSLQTGSAAATSAQPSAEVVLVHRDGGVPTRQAGVIKPEPVLQVDDDDEDLGELLGLMK